MAIDSTTGNVYVSEPWFLNNRVDEFTPDGQFVLMLGKGVNETTGGNLCTQVEVEAGIKCKASVPWYEMLGSTERGAVLLFGAGNEITVGGPQDLLYVGSEHRLQEFETNGTWVGEISLESLSSEEFMGVQSVAVDQANGNVYLTYAESGGSPPGATIYEYETNGSANGKLVGEIKLSPREAGATANVEGIALDGNGQLAVSEEERGTSTRWFGSLLDAANGSRLGEFPVLASSSGFNRVPGLAFNAAGELYGAAKEREEVVGYVFKEGAELIAKPKPVLCKQASEQHESLIADDCNLNGEANPANVSETQAWFQLGTTKALAGVGTVETAKQSFATSNNLEPVNGVVEGLRPNETYYYRLAGEDHNFKPPIPALTSEELSFTTSPVPPQVVGQASASFVKSGSVVFSGEVNPENASTTYTFEYGTCEHLSGCATLAHTETLESNAYHKLEAKLEAKGLQSAKTYHYRLSATNTTAGEHHETTQGPEATFTTAARVTPQAGTGGPSAVTATSAIVSGEVNPDGQPAVYTFELGVYEGAGTRYGIVVAAPAGEGTGFVPETLQLSGLQPGVQYAYRIILTSAYGTSEGAAVTFTTAGVPAVLAAPTPLPQLAVPSTLFPNEVKTKPKPKVVHKKSKKAKRKKAKKRGKAGKKGKRN